MLAVRKLQAFHGRSQVLHDVDFDLHQGEVLALLGRNGSGRSSTAGAIMGLLRWQGVIAWKGQPLKGMKTFEIARLGLAHVPESRDIFPTLTVHQNLLLGQKSLGRIAGASALPWSFEDSYRSFPQLHQRRDITAGVLSGGEQLMLSLCRGLMGEPELLIIDEPTEGLAPQMVGQISALLQALRQRGVAVLLIEQKLDVALANADRVLVMGRGEIVFDGTPEALRNDVSVQREWLEIQGR